MTRARASGRSSHPRCRVGQDAPDNGTGTARDVAAFVQQRALNWQLLDTQIDAEEDTFPVPHALPQNSAVVVVGATSGDGKVPENARLLQLRALGPIARGLGDDQQRLDPRIADSIAGEALAAVVQLPSSSKGGTIDDPPKPMEPRYIRVCLDILSSFMVLEKGVRCHPGNRAAALLRDVIAAATSEEEKEKFEELAVAEDVDLLYDFYVLRSCTMSSSARLYLMRVHLTVAVAGFLSPHMRRRHEVCSFIFFSVGPSKKQGAY
ncbi:unnamed protein product [Hyaloperonospora brassicae]|uniref:Uncharacterized protein n=1 Tax=Hyaloperonospora brassicae TaxID=162125 RepID=A0AAV0UCX1_HYABA|nr:unnamed protein product [Hyaloperonospora brassicae]